MVVCIDVLEHIEPECIDSVLDHLKDLTERILFVTICMTSSSQWMDDGRNAHLIQEPKEWWLPKIEERFDIYRAALLGVTHVAVLASNLNKGSKD